MSSVSDYSSIVSAGVTCAGLLASGIAALWGRLEYTNRKTRQALSQCERRETEYRARSAVKVTVIELLWQEIRRIAPHSQVLRRARLLLDNIHRMECCEEHGDMDEDEGL